MLWRKRSYARNAVLHGEFAVAALSVYTLCGQCIWLERSPRRIRRGRIECLHKGKLPWPLPQVLHGEFAVAALSGLWLWLGYRAWRFGVLHGEFAVAALSGGRTHPFPEARLGSPRRIRRGR